MRKVAFILVFLAGAGLVEAGEAGPIKPYLRGTFARIHADHSRRPIIVHFWSLTCPPCLTEMPRLAEFIKRRNDIDLVLVATDSIDQSDRLMTRLEKWGLTGATNFAYADQFEERLRFEVDRTWHGELPFTAVVRRDGAMTTFLGELKFEQIESALEQPLQQSPPQTN